MGRVVDLVFTLIGASALFWFAILSAVAAVVHPDQAVGYIAFTLFFGACGFAVLFFAAREA